MKQVLDELNKIEEKLREDIADAVDFYADRTDDAETYIGQLEEIAMDEQNDIMDDYPDVNFQFIDGRWVIV